MVRALVSITVLALAACTIQLHIGFSANVPDGGVVINVPPLTLPDADLPPGLIDMLDAGVDADADEPLPEWVPPEWTPP